MNVTSNKVALLVGAGDAIGAAVARRFADGGYSVAIARRSAESSDELIADIAAAGGIARAYSTDVRDEEQVQKLFETVENDLGPVAVCLFNAGSNVSKPVQETSAKLFFKAWELACFGGFLVGREATRRMAERGAGTMLFTGATASIKGRTGFTAFASAKFALRGVAQAMAREMGPQNIHVAHLVIDAGVNSPAIHERMRAAGVDVDAIDPDSLVSTGSVAEAYWYLHNQPRDAWTHELDLRPSVEAW
ncbi:short-chain dehydrogenase [Sulfitobacter sp. EhC04]|uniref:SDR family NAD(P)-dependent oxidoreductase n=1 Tax=Sulfitobacter sp. EhC04 TaxID=1849168 RepID=UPI0007F45628|nr:SDR family NAD(P)-dependent oxidoreductase [Sulfitobacter sp. EhC04]OAN75640.1 short-chain dehydrogenase [Sulfitobacter sp. EhC04]